MVHIFASETDHFPPIKALFELVTSVTLSIFQQGRGSRKGRGRKSLFCFVLFFSVIFFSSKQLPNTPDYRSTPRVRTVTLKTNVYKHNKFDICHSVWIVVTYWIFAIAPALQYLSTGHKKSKGQRSIDCARHSRPLNVCSCFFEQRLKIKEIKRTKPCQA